MQQFLEKNITLKNMLIGILILIICFMKYCEADTIIKANKGKSDTITIITTKVDTIKQTTKVYVPVPISTTIIDTIQVHNWHTDMSVCQYVNYYSDTIADSNIQIVIKDTVQGWLRARKVDYTFYQKTIYINKTITKQPKYAIFVGAEAGGNINEFGISPAILVRRDGTIVNYHYDLINKTHNLGVNFQIFKSKR